jgi:transcription elongation factor GreA
MKNYMTRSGYDKLVEELNLLTTQEQRKASEMLSEARDKGDLSENAEYEAAKEFQENLAKKISRMSEMIRTAEIVHPDGNTDRVGMVSTIRIMNHKIGVEQVWTLVSENEVDTKNGKISFNSPIGSALIGKKRGDLVDVSIPTGTMKLEVLDIL